MADEMAESDPRLALAVQRAASLHAVAAARGVALEPPSQAPEIVSKNLAVADPQTLAYVSGLAFNVAQAHQRGDRAGEKAALAKLKDFIRKYSTLDLLGWMQCVWRYIAYYVTANQQPPYRDWSEQTPPDLNFGEIEYKLPNDAKILMIGDWGTHMTDNVAMLRQGLCMLKPDIIIHLGDVYYSGTNYECEQ